ncbi:MAG TPA: aldo/keto reductase [Candidatus Dormibacteraeota bacterium]|nr:aldo/keto reductase [Candidatus Dormibacteraeota bacterium]
MDSRTLGASGLKVTPIGIGLAGVGRPAYLGFSRDGDLGSDRSVEALQQLTHDLLDLAYESGVRYVDAARSYGLAERFLGAWLRDRKRPPGDPVVGSKWGYAYVGDWSMDAEVHEVKDHSLDALRRQYVESRAELGDHLLLYQIHSATLETGVLGDRTVLAELARLKEQDISIGLSVSGPAQAEVIKQSLDARIDGERVFQTVQATWNLLERSAGEALAEAHEAGYGVIVKEALANGRLAGRAEAASGVLAEIASGHGVNVDAVAIAAALANPWVHVVLSGATTVEQLSSNLEALSVRLSASELDTLETRTQASRDYWLQRQSIPWR